MTDAPRPRRIQECSFREIGDEGGLVVLPGRAEVKVLNPAAIRIFGLFDGRHTVDQIADVVVREFEVERDVAIADIRRFAEQLDEHGMMESDPGGRVEESKT